MLLAMLVRALLMILAGVIVVTATPTSSRADLTVHRFEPVVDLSRVSVAARQRDLGNDPARMFGYVRDTIRHDAYSGALRGAAGALLAEAANSVDRALLLQELLLAAGHRARVAHGTLDPGAAETVLKGAFRLKMASPGTGGDPKAKALFESFKNDAVSQYRAILGALQDAGVSIPAGPTSAYRELIEETRDHYWVQYLRDGSWVDLDPSMPTAKVGDRFAVAAETFDDLPANRFHRVTVRVVLEEDQGGERRRRTLLSHTARAVDLVAAPLVLTHQAGSWRQPQPAEALLNAFGAITDALSGVFGALGGGGGGASRKPEDRVRPVLVAANNEYKVGDVFDLRHPQNEATGAAPGDGAVAEWIEFELQAPTGRIDRTDRVIFDRVGFAARRKAQQQVMPGPLGIDHPLNATFCLSFYTGPLVSDAVFARQKPGNRTTTVAGSATIAASDVDRFLKGLNDTVHLVSERLVLPLTANGQPVLYTATTPRIVISALRSSPTGTTLSLDLRHARYRPVATASTLENAFRLQVLKGVVDGVVEDVIIGRILGATATRTPPVGPATYSTRRVFSESARQGVKARAFTTAPDTTVAGSETAAAWMAADTAGGNVVVAPGRPVTLGGRPRTAWWRVAKTTGETVGVTDDGLHQGSGEYFQVVQDRQANTITTVMVTRPAPGITEVVVEFNVALAEAVGQIGLALAARFEVFILVL